MVLLVFTTKAGTTCFGPSLSRENRKLVSLTKAGTQNQRVYVLRTKAGLKFLPGIGGRHPQRGGPCLILTRSVEQLLKLSDESLTPYDLQNDLWGGGLIS